MQIQQEQSLDDYVRLGDETTRELLNSDQPIMAALREFHDFIPRTLWAGDVKMTPEQAFLSTNAFMLYLSAVRVALSGHVVATFPLFRTALESACYSYLMGRDSSLAEIWVKRHSSAEAAKACRGRLTSAVKDAAMQIERSGNAAVGTDQWINDGYQLAIDFGAHPNPKSVLHHITEPVDDGDRWLMTMTGLYTADANQVLQSLFACLDYGILIGTVLLHAQSESPSIPSAINELHRLHRLKDELAAKHRSRP